jgi:hypothetical protein
MGVASGVTTRLNWEKEKEKKKRHTCLDPKQEWCEKGVIGRRGGADMALSIN